jgi:N-succinyldiaminopimelate aminotransferase
MLSNPRLAALSDYPFDRLRALLADLAPGAPPIVLSVGEPRHAPPPLLKEALAAANDGWGRYPPVEGTAEFRAAACDWLTRRYALPAGFLDPDRHVLPVAGTREGLFTIALAALPERKAGDRPVVLLPNPFYQVYLGAAVIGGAEPVLLPAGRESGFLPDLDAVPAAVLERTAICYLCSPANPQGAVADVAFLERAVALARRHAFLLVVDECYGEIYDVAPPPGALAAAAAAGGGPQGVVVFHSLSKRSSAPGLRSGFVAGDAEVLAAFRRLRSYGGATLPLPVLAASAALWRDETHVAANRALYRAKFDMAERLLAGRFGFYRPSGGFFLWLDVGDGEAAARTLWRETGVRVLPGAYLARAANGHANPGRAFIRVALVDSLAVTEDALRRLNNVL